MSGRRGGPPASDIYEVGLVMQRCFPDGARPGLSSVMGRALAPMPADRWATATRMRSALRAYDVARER